MEKTVVLVKPDGVKRGLCGEIISRFEKVGLKIVAMKMVWVDADHVKKHYPSKREDWLRKIGEKTLKAYEEYGKDPQEKLGTLDPLEIGRMINKWNVDYLTSGPVVAMVLEGNHAISVVRKLVGFTHPNLADAGTIRAELSCDSTDAANESKRAARNLVHASGNLEEAKFEEELWFHKKEIHAYKRVDEDLIYG
jgi:nucleoside-diphosphate kinase